MNIATMPAALAGVSDEEWRIRCDLAALYRLAAHHRWTDFVDTHISARLAYHGYEGIALDIDERERLVADLGEHKAMILRNHGLLMAGTSIPDAFHTTYMLERACAAQVAALAGGQQLVYPPEAVCRHTAEQFRTTENGEHYSWMWQSALRLIENDRPDYRS